MTSSFFVLQAQRDLNQAPQQRAAGAHRLPQVGGRLRDRAAGAARRRRQCDRRYRRAAASPAARSSSCSSNSSSAPAASTVRAAERPASCRPDPGIRLSAVPGHGHRHHLQRSRQHRGRARVRRAGPTRSSSSTARAPTTPSAIARRFTDKVIVRPWPGYVAQKNFAADAGQPRLDPLARRRRAGDAGAGRRDPRRCCDGEPARRRLSRAARDVSPRPLDPIDRLVSRLPAAPLRSPPRALGRALRPRIGEGRRAGRPICAASSSTTPIATSRIICRRWTATRRWRRGRCSRTAGAPAGSTCWCTRRRRSSATTCCAAGSATACPA